MLHFTSRGEWERGRLRGQYEPDAMAADGFVHLSYGHQVARVATALARARRDLVLLVVDPTGLEADLRVEDGFPRLYRPIPASAVRLVADFPPDDRGCFALPDDARLAESRLTALPSFDAVVERARSVMAPFAGPWWIGGGWATDAVTGTISRPHLDLDLVVLRPDVEALAVLRTAWDVRLPRSGSLVPWDGGALDADDHQFWLRPDDGQRPDRWQEFAADPGFFEILVERLDALRRLWQFRRDPALTAPLERLGPPGGFLGPEVALLYKAAAAAGDDEAGRRKAQGDFDHAVVHLDAERRAWLRGAVEVVHPGHPWGPVLTG